MYFILIQYFYFFFKLNWLETTYIIQGFVSETDSLFVLGNK